MEVNQAATELLLKGTVVDGVAGWEQGRGRTVHFIDWDNPQNNCFRVVNQFQVACPAGQADKHIRPDIVLFVNGIPLVIVECKSPYAATPLEDAVDQLQRYANRRRELGLVDLSEGNEQLFHYSQFVVATCGEQARAGTFSSLAVHFLEWKDTSPRPIAEVAEELGQVATALTSQERLVAGMLRPAHLLDIVRHFTLFMELGGRRVKLVCRYQQFRAVQLAIRRMLTGKTRREDGEQDRRGGIVWHTQGSGKSLTMVFLIRKMRSDPTLRRFKVIVVTDRRDLQKQLADTAALTDEVLTIVKPERRGAKTVSSAEVLQETLARKGKDLVFAMIQKYRGELLDADASDDTNGADEDAEDTAGRAPTKTRPFPELNTDEDILVLVDEAHRSHTNSAHANLMQALPNCVRIGFTGTPIIMRAKGQTARIFGAFIDRYTLRESEADGATVPIRYEGRTTGAAVKDGRALDEVFEDMLVGRTPEELEAIKQKYATKGHVMEAERLIAAKARNMLRHYVENILPNGFKAQVVAVSRRATIRYYRAFLEARDALVDELAALHPNLLGLDDDAVNRLAPEKAFLIRAHRFLPTIAALDFAPVISGGHNDSVDPQREWSSRAKIDARIARFKKPLFADGPNTFVGDKADPLAFLIVKSMLLTGFDAPVEQVMYLDRHIKEAELLQAIARVNRTYSRGGAGGGGEKSCGIVVDYYGVARHLKDALAAYSAEDVEGALESLKDEIPKLRDRHRRALEVFLSRGIEDIAETEACVQLLKDEKLRAEFHVKLKQFLVTLDLVLPRPEGLPFVNDAKTLAHIQARARNRYRGSERLIGKEVGEKVRKLIDDHVLSLGIDPRIPPIEITSIQFETHVEQERSSRAKASEMEHALRYHIRKHLDEDPTHYEKLSERLRDILKEFEGRWDALAEALKTLVEEAAQGRQRDDSTGLDPATQAFLDVLLVQLARDVTVEAETTARLREVVVELVDHIRQEIALVGFWQRAHAREGLRGWIFQTLDDAEVLPFGRLDAVADTLMDLAKANHHRLTE
ncbi:type I restriction endonuclease subunit R [Thiocapsa bogorovii]|uniref:type I restriction endonuclease subunit R n=1 Tax=Thiocapsa bogorovii TaxID=521689 RepID=UPI0022B5F7CF|nr:HsdR family type I site-specific deoxyribonuclease [Thiocapsa bogorovii]